MALFAKHLLFNISHFCILMFLAVGVRDRRFSTFPNTAEPRYNEGPREWQNVFVITNLSCIEVLLHLYILLLLVRGI